MTHIHGQHDSELHHDDGSHRSTPSTSDGHALANHARRMAQHMAAHRAELETARAEPPHVPMKLKPSSVEGVKPHHSYQIAFADRAHLPNVPRPGRLRAIWTGECPRPPRRGEWFLSGAIIEAYYAPNDLSTPYHIARLVRAVETITYEPI